MMMTDKELRLAEEELFNDPDYLEWLEERAEEAREMEAWEHSFQFGNEW